MSAINAIVTPTAAFMISDGLRYNNGEVTCVDFDKSFVLRGVRAAVAATGDAKTGFFFRAAIEDEFKRFDDLVSAGSAFFVEGFRAFAHRFCGGNAVSNVVLIGWLEGENRPAAFAIDLVEGMCQWRGVSSGGCDAHGTLEEHPVIAAPCPSLDEMLAGGYPLGAAGDCVDPESKLVRMLEIQRRMRADDGKYYVGGLATLTSVTANGVAQRVVHRRPDKVGEVIKPEPVGDWRVFRRELKGWRKWWR